MRDITPPPIIEHDENEFTARKTAGIWWAAFAMLTLLWCWYLYSRSFDRDSLLLGGLTAGIFVAWACDVTDGKVPKSWRTPRS